MSSTQAARTTPDPNYILHGANAPVTYLFYSPHSSHLLYSGGCDGVVNVWDLNEKRIKIKLDGHDGNSILWITSPDDRHLITQGRDGCIQFWTEKNGDWEKTGKISCSSLNFCSGCLLHQSSSTLLLSPSDVTSQVNIIDYNSNSKVCTLKPRDEKNSFGMCMSIQSVENELTAAEILVGYENGIVALWDIRSRQIVSQIQPHEESVMCMAYSSTSNKGISGSAGDVISGWEINEAGELKEKATVTVSNPGFSDVKIRTDSKIFATAGWDSNVRIFGLKKLKPLAVLSFHKQTVQSVAFSTDNALACGSKDKLISLWDIYR